MLKKTVAYVDIDEKGGEVAAEAVIRFVYTLPAVRLYESRTGGNFFEDYRAAFMQFSGLLSMYSDGEKKDFSAMGFEDQIKFLPILVDPVISKFLMDVAPCMYAEIEGGRFVQNEETAATAEGAMWFMDLVNIGFFAEIFAELSTDRLAEKTGVKKATKKK